MSSSQLLKDVQQNLFFTLMSAACDNDWSVTAPLTSHCFGYFAYPCSKFDFELHAAGTMH